MDKQTLWLELYKGCTVNHGPFEEYFAPNGTSTVDWIDYIKEDGGAVIRYEIHVYLDGDLVKEASTFKAAVRATGGRPIIDEKELTAAEKKQTKEILNQCLQFPEENELPGIIASSVNSEWNGYRILGDAGDSIAYRGPDGKKKKIKKETVILALHYGHSYLEMHREEAFVQEFCTALGIRRWEPLCAFMRIVSPENDPNMARLEVEYQYRKLAHAITEGNVDACQQYGSVLRCPDIDLASLFLRPIETKNSELCEWLFQQSEGNPCNLEEAMTCAIRYDPSFAEKLLQSGRCFPSKRYDWPRLPPISEALYYKNYPFVKELVFHGFPLNAEDGKKLYPNLPLDEIKELLAGSITLTEDVLEKIWEAQRLDILEIIEKEKDRYISSQKLLALYIRKDLHQRFLNGLDHGFLCDDDILTQAYMHDPEWAEEIFARGFDVNSGNGQALFHACEMQNAPMMAYLLKKGADVHLKPESYMNLYESAIPRLYYEDKTEQQETEDICRQLMCADLDPITECFSEPSFVSQMLRYSVDFKHFLIDWLADHDELNCLDMQEKLGQRYDPHVPLYHTISWRGIDTETARYMIQKGALTDVTAFSKDRLFVRACEKADLGYVKLLAESGANLEETDLLGNTGLMVAAEQNRVEICQYLISCGADLNAVVAIKKYKTVREKPTIIYKTALDIAEENSAQQCAELLSAAGAKRAEKLSK